ncbi:MAG: glutathione S-transferase family protein [Polyangiaceae bacterium]|nr:glutathione S-transferase family protein [Polyangiaceae bacterium]
MKLHGFPMSPNTRRAQLGLEEAALPYELVPVDLMSAAHKQPDYLRLNPTGRVPVLVDGELALWESNAILRYVAELAPERQLDGDTPKGRARIAQWMFMNAAHLSPALAHVFAHTIRLPEADRIPKLVENGRNEIARCVGPLDQQLTGREWIVDRFSIADVSIAASLAVAPMIGVDLTPYPNVLGWQRRIQERPAYRKIYG